MEASRLSLSGRGGSFSQKPLSEMLLFLAARIFGAFSYCTFYLTSVCNHMHIQVGRLHYIIQPVTRPHASAS